MDDGDRSRAAELRSAIIAASSNVVSLELIKDYILCNCCTFAKPAGHRQTMEDDGNLMPLARRWQNEIWARAAPQSIPTSSVPTPQNNIFFAQYPPTTPATSTPSYTATSYNYQHNPVAPGNINTAASSYIASYTYPQYISPTPTTAGSLQQFTDLPRDDHVPYQASPSHYPNNPTPSNYNSALSDPIASSPSHKYSVRTAPASSEPPQSAGNPPRYTLRSREVSGLNSTPDQSASDSKPPQSEFRIYKPEPGPDDSVAQKILAPLEDNDLITGSLYGFTRDSSPGHIKIGWTTSVDDRLKYWSKHGDNPKLLFSVHLVPFAQRAETLTHHELIKEWRWERRCEGQACNVNHMEWFEVSKYRAKQVVADWAEFIERAEPYDRGDRSLKPFWKKEVETMDGRGELITAKKLLERYEASLVEEPTLNETSLVIAEPPIEVESLIKRGPRPNSEPEVLSSSPKPNVKAESDSLSATRKELADARVDIKELQDTIASIMQRLQNIELGIEAEPQLEVLPRDTQIRAKVGEGSSHRQVGSPTTKVETEEEADGWADDTLLGDQSPNPLGKIAKIVDGIAAGISAGKTKAVEKGFDRPKVHELGATPLILP